MKKILCVLMDVLITVQDVIVINGILLIEKLNEKYYFNFHLFLAIGTITYISMRMKNEPISELALANIEALAQNEGSDVDCPNNGNGCYNGLWYPCKREVYN
jgi:hypothetical protein